MFMASITGSIYFIDSLATSPPCYMPPLLPGFTGRNVLFSTSTTYRTALCGSCAHCRLWVFRTIFIPATRCSCSERFFQIGYTRTQIGYTRTQRRKETVWFLAVGGLRVVPRVPGWTYCCSRDSTGWPWKMAVVYWCVSVKLYKEKGPRKLLMIW